MPRALSLVVAAVLLTGVSYAAADLTQASTAIHVAVVPTPSISVAPSTTSTSLSVATTTSTVVRRAARSTTSLVRPASSTACSITGPRHDVVQQGAITGTVVAFVAAETARFLAVGARCPTITLTAVDLLPGMPLDLPTLPGMSIPRAGFRVEETWIGQPGEDRAAADAYAGYLLSEGRIALRPPLGTSGLPCTGTPDLSGTAPADVSQADRCLHLGGRSRPHPGSCRPLRRRPATRARGRCDLWRKTR